LLARHSVSCKGGEEASRECPECYSKKNWKAGIRQTQNGEVQRFLCRDRGSRFSEFQMKGKCQLSAISEEAKKLDSATETKTVTGESQKVAQDTKGKILEFAWYLKKQNSSDSTIRTFTCLLKKLVSNGAKLYDPESVKEVLAKLIVSQNSKALIVATYSSFLKFNNRSWIPPIYKRQDKIPFIPQESELDSLISGCSRRLSTPLLLLKETGMRIGESCRLKWTDINPENNTVAINEPEKGSNARIIRVSGN
jgi:integrase